MISDDYTLVRRVDGRLLASPPPTIAGKLEVRNLGILKFDHVDDVPVCLYVDLDRPVERQPEEEAIVSVAGIAIPVIALNGLEASAPVKVELAAAHNGRKSR